MNRRNQNYLKPHSVHPLLRLGEVRMEFWVLGEVIQNIFDFFWGGCPMSGGY